MSFKHALILAPFLVALTACQKEPAPAAEKATAPQPSATQTAAPESSSAVISVTPASIQNCDPGVEATIRWDVSKAKVATDSTEIWVGTDAASMKLFSAGGATGETKTGAWTHPGTHFMLKNRKDGNPLGEVVVGGPTCNN